MRAAILPPPPPLTDLTPGAVRDRLVAGWPKLMLAKFASDIDCAAFFGRTRQTGTYWRAGHCKPDGPALALAWLLWPEDCVRLFGGRA
jgi:hypothetical protein